MNPVESMEGYCFSTRAGMRACYEAAKDVLERGVTGDFVECGVAAGGLAGCIGRAMIDTGNHRRFHLLDSYEGLPMAGPHDDWQPGAWTIGDRLAPIEERLKPSGIGPANTVEQVRANFETFGLGQLDVVYHKGWFQHTAKRVAASIDSIALLHLDGDLYESTLVCLEAFYPKMSRGGVVIVDDHELNGCQKAVRDYFGDKLPRLERFADYGSRAWRVE